MDPERWRQVKEILYQALELASEQRPAFLDRTCGSDVSLRRELDSLISSGVTEDPGFLHSPLPLSVPIGPGIRLGDYEILSLLGAGGMGEVYRARDRRLERDVAIKVLGNLFVDPDRLRRFELEARAAAALNHPNILAVYYSGTHEGVPYLVSELLEGETLGGQLKRGALPTRKAIEYGTQIARGLSAAHDKGVVHRDLKPENIFVTKDGQIKILDFGLAKLARPGAEGFGAGTQPGLLMGTMGYMSPEQVRGQEVDARSDIFAFGVVLYEMLTGQQAFRKATPSDTISAILMQEPASVSGINRTVSPGLERVVHRCLEKSPEQRFQSASDLAFALDALSNPSGWSSAQIPLPKFLQPRSGSGSQQAPWKILIPIALTIGVVVAGALYSNSRRSARLANKDTVVLADFINRTGDPVFDDTLKEALAIQLEQSSFLKVLSDDRMNATLGLMDRPVNTRITQQVAQEVCQRTGSKAFLSGSVTNIGDDYVVGLKGVNCQTGDTLGSSEAEAKGRANVLKALDRAANDLRQELGESIASVSKSNKPLEQATTSSLDALKAFTLGLRTQGQRGTPEAIPYYKEATHLDANFARAYAALGTAYANLNQPNLSIESYRRAFELRERVSERERFYIEAGYYSNTTGDLEKADQVYQQWSQAYPDDDIPHLDLGFNYALLGEYAKSVAETKEDLRITPDDVVGRGNLIIDYLALDRLDEARAEYSQATNRKLDGSDLRLPRFYVAFLENDVPGMQEQLAWGLGKAGQEDSLLSAQSDTEAYYGHLAKARALSHRAVESAKRNDEKETAGMWQVNAALRESEFGNEAHARAQAAAAIEALPGRNVQLLGALAQARAGDVAKAQRLADSLDQEFPQDTIIQNYWLPTIGAAMQLSKGNAHSAIERLQAAAPYELGNPQQYLVGTMYPVYLRGLALLKLGRGSEAAAEFQRLLDHRGIVVNFPLGVLAHLQLGRALALGGNPAGARRQYQDFLALWKDADPDIPVLRQARAEYAKLQ